MAFTFGGKVSTAHFTIATSIMDSTTAFHDGFHDHGFHVGGFHAGGFHGGGSHGGRG
jgi:hypothetical protein